jgi:menaquinone-dependent protoporphyrinogen oxidase
MKILVVYASRYGQTEKIAWRIAGVAENEGIGCTVASLADAPPLHEFNDVIVAGSIYFGRHARSLRRFVRRNLRALEERHTAFVTVCGDPALAPPIVEKFVRDTGWEPDVSATFAGATRYTRYGWLLRHIVRRAAAAAHPGDTDMTRDYEYTDWNAVAAFARSFAAEALRRAA